MTPEELNDREAIKALKYAYLRCLDQKNWDELATLLVEDATAAYSGGRYTYAGRDEIVAFVERNMGREQFHSSHRAHHPEIRLDGDRAEATWALEDIVHRFRVGLPADRRSLLRGRLRAPGRSLVDPAHGVPPQLRVHAAHVVHRGVRADRQLVGDRRAELPAGHVTSERRRCERPGRAYNLTTRQISGATR